MKKIMTISSSLLLICLLESCASINEKSVNTIPQKKIHIECGVRYRDLTKKWISEEYKCLHQVRANDQ